MLPWVEDNGYELERGAFGQQEQTDKIMQSVATDTYLADIFQFPSNARADVIGANALQEIPQEVDLPAARCRHHPHSAGDPRAVDALCRL